MRVLNPTTLAAVLSMQKDLSDILKKGPAGRDLLGELFLESRRITRKQLTYALREQRTTGEKLGELLVHRNFVTDEERYVALAFQRQMRGGIAGPEKLRLGEILVAAGQITPEQREVALRRQRRARMRIGEILIEAGFVHPDQVGHGLSVQEKLVAAAISAALSFSALPLIDEARAANALNAKVAIRAVVREHTTVDIVRQITELRVTKTDVLRGYLQAPAASRIMIKTNNPAGCLLMFELSGDADLPFKTVHVTVGGREILFPTGSGWVRMPYIKGGAAEDVSYRFDLAKSAQPGIYPWPLVISVLPVGNAGRN